MGTPNYEKEFARLSALAENEEGSADSRIKAARKLLYHTEFSARALRVGKRVAKLFLTHGDDSIRKRAANLLVFTVEKKTDDAEDAQEASEAAAPASSPAAAMNSVGPRLWYLQMDFEDPDPTKEQIEEFKQRVLAGIDPNRPMTPEYAKELETQFQESIKGCESTIDKWTRNNGGVRKSWW